MARKCVRFGRANGRKVCRKFSGGKGRKAKGAKKCAGLKVKGTLKKGYTWKGAKGACPRKAQKTARRVKRSVASSYRQSVGL